MRNTFKYIVLLLAIVASSFSADATHIIGGDITYEHIMGDTYEISFTFRRDCFNGDPEAQFDNQAVIWIFDDNGYLLQQYGIGGRIVMNLNPDDTLGKTFRSDCGFEGDQVCVQETTYKERVRLPYRPGKGGYTLAYQRCCRNNTLANILNPEDTGGTWMTVISEEALATQNSSPRFNQWPDVYICTGEDINFSHAATDAEGDSLVYKLYTPLQGLSDAKPVPFGPPYPPYTTVEWKAPYGLDNLLGGTPLTIDSETGMIHGTPDQVGQFLVGVVVEEYRDGKLIGFTRRDFQYNVRVCVDPPSAEFTANNGECTGKEVTFENNSVAGTAYQWNFNYPSEDPVYQSTEENPTFTYPQEGVYDVQLIAIRNVDGCRDVVVKSVPALKGSIDQNFKLQIDECRSDGKYMVSVTDTSMDLVDEQSINGYNWTIIQNGEERMFATNPASFIVENADFKIVSRVTSTTGCTSELERNIDIDDFTHVADFKYELVDCPSGDQLQVRLIDNSDNATLYDTPEKVEWNVVTPEGTLMGEGSEFVLTTAVSSIITVNMVVDFGGGCTAFLSRDFDVSDILPRLSFDYKGLGCPDFETVNLEFTIRQENMGVDLSSVDVRLYAEDGSVLHSGNSASFESVVPKNKDVRLVLMGTFENGCLDTLDETFIPGPFASLEFTAVPRKVCMGDTVAMLANGNPEWNYTWTPTENLFFPTSGSGHDVRAIGVESTTYTVSVEDGICSEERDIDVEVLDGNNLMIEGDRIVCDDQVVLTAIGGIPPGNFEWSYTEDFQEILFTGTTLTTTLVGDATTYYVRFTGETCGDDYVKAEVVKRIFTVDVGGDEAQVCLGDTSLLIKNPNPDFTYSWGDDDALIFPTGESNEPYIIGISDRVINVDITDGKCNGSLEIPVNVLDTFDLKIIGESQICEGEDIFLRVNPIDGNGSYEWSFDPNFSAIISNTTTLEAPLSGDAAEVYVRYTGPSCGKTSDQISLNRSNIDISFLPPPIRICKGDSVHLIPDPVVSYVYEWAPMEGLYFAPEDEVLADPMFVGDKDISYTVTVKDGRCEKQYTIDIDVADTKNISVEGQILLCDEQVNLTAVGADGNGEYEWSLDPDFGSILSTGSILNTTLEGDSTTYYVRYTDAVCGDNVFAQKVSKYEFELLYVEPYYVCPGDTLDYSVFNEGAGTLTYVWDNDPHIVDGGDSGSPTIGFSDTEQDTVVLYFTATNQVGCSIRKQVDFVLTDFPEVDFVHTLTECGKNEMCFKVEGDYFGFIKWDFGDPSTTDDVSIEDSICYTYPGKGVYKVVLENLTQSCKFEPVEKLITINDDVNFDDLGYQQGCEGSTIAIEPTTDDYGLTYVWTTFAGDTLSTSTTLSYNVTGRDTLYLNATDPNGCTYMDTVFVGPYVYDLNPDFPEVFCNDEPVQISVSVNGTTDGFSYQWTPVEAFSSGADTANPTIAINKDTRVKVQITDDEHGCLINESYLLEYSPLELDIAADPGSVIYLGQSLELDVIPSMDGLSYTWSTGETTQKITVMPEQATTYYVDVVDEYGCMATDTINVEVRQPNCDETDVFIPSAFTPNGDDINSILYVRSNFIKTMELVIYNRWGQEVFRSTDQSVGWDGTFEGKQLEPDAFAYYLKVTCVDDQTYQVQGNINLLK